MSAVRQAIIVQSDDSPELRAAARILREHPAAPSQLVLADGETVALPATVTEALQLLVVYLLDEGGAAISPAEREYTADEAADFLGVVTPFLHNLLEDGTILSRVVEGERVIALPDLLVYDAALRALRAEGVRLIQQLSEEEGAYGK